MSISSAIVTVTDWPATATARSPSSSTRATVLSRPDGSTFTRAPGETVPEAIWPQKPRKSRSGRFTHCTGRRNGRSWPPTATGTVSRCCISDGPEYQGICVLGVAMFSPARAESGIATTSAKPSGAAKAVYSATMRSNTAWS